MALRVVPVQCQAYRQNYTVLHACCMRVACGQVDHATMLFLCMCKLGPCSKGLQSMAKDMRA